VPLGIEEAHPPGAVGREYPVGTDDLVARVVADHEVLAPWVEHVLVAAGAAGDPRSQLVGEDAVSQPLRGLDVGAGGRKADRETSLRRPRNL
jgi:hypothetical protein